MNNSVMSDLITLFDDEIDLLKDEINSLNKEKEVKEKLKNFNSIEKIVDADQDELFSLIKKIIPSFDVDQDLLKQHIYFYKSGINNAMFRKTDRYLKTRVILTTIADSFEKYSSVEVEDEKEIKEKLSIVSSIKKGLSLNPPKCDINTFESVDFILNNDSLTDEEKVSFLSILTKASYSYLVNEEKRIQEEADKQIEEEIRKNEEEIKNNIINNGQNKDSDDSKFGEIIEILESDQDTKKELKKLNLSDDKKEKLDKLRIIYEKNTYKLAGCSNNLLDTFNTLEDSLLSRENTLDVIKQSYTKEDFEKFCIYLSGKKLVEINEDLSNSYEEVDIEEAAQLVDINLSLLEELSKYLYEDDKLKDEKVDEKVDENESRKLIFYGYDLASSQFEKDISSFSKEKISDAEILIDRLENGRLSNGQRIYANSPLKLNEIYNGNVFVVYRVMPNNHILVVRAEPIENINKQQIERKLSNISQKEIKKLEDTIKDGTLEYRKVMDKNTTILNNVKKSFESKRGSYE